MALVTAALLCHFLYYLVPGFLMGILHFGWMGVNTYFSASLLVAPFGYAPLSLPHQVASVIWVVAGCDQH